MSASPYLPEQRSGSKWERAISAAVFAAAGLLAAAILFYVLLHQQRLVTTTWRAAFFVGVPVLGLGISLMAFRLPSEWRLAVALSLLAGAFSLYSAELYLISRAQALEPGLPPNFDTRQKIEVIADLRAHGRNAYPAVFPNYLLATSLGGDLHSPIVVDGKEVLPLAGIPAVLSVLCNESGTYEIFESDEMGFNNPPGLWSGPLQVAAIGDSFTQGYCVPRDDSFVGRIRSRFPRTVSLGMSGAGPLVELATIKEFLPERRPAQVLWFFTEGNDLPGDLEIEKRSPLLLSYLEPDFRQGLQLMIPEITVALTRHVNGILDRRDSTGNSNAGNLQTVISFLGLSAVRGALRFPSTIPDQPDYALFERALVEAKRVVSSWGGCLRLAHLSGHPAGDRPQMARIRSDVRAITERLDIPYIDVHTALRNQPDPLKLFPFGRPAHYGVEGHRIVAETILAALPDGVASACAR